MSVSITLSSIVLKKSRPRHKENCILKFLSLVTLALRQKNFDFKQFLIFNTPLLVLVNSLLMMIVRTHKIFIYFPRLDWGPEGVLQKLITLWNSGIYPIGMNEIVQSNKQRISAATAFFSVMGKSKVTTSFLRTELIR